MSNKDQDAKETVQQDSASQPSNESLNDASEQLTTDNDKQPSSSADDGKQPPVAKSKTGKSSAGKWILWCIILLAVCACAYYGWTLWDNYQTAQQKASTLDRLSQQVASQQQSLEQLTNDSKQQAYELSQINHQLSLQLEQLQQELKTTQQKITATDEQQNIWMLAEAEYLIRQAAYKLHYTDNAKSIIALLQAADRQVLAMNDSSLQPLRQAISDDIAAVRASGAIDIDGIAIKLQSLKSQVPQLELATVQLPDGDSIQESEPAPQEQEELSAWQRFKNAFSSALSQYYTVHHYDESMKPFLSPQHDALLRQNILLNLQTAQLAALQHNPAIYQNALLEIKDWVGEYFKAEPAATQAFLQQLDELINAKVALQLPQQLQSLRTVERLTGRQSQLNNSAKAERVVQTAPQQEDSTAEELPSEEVSQ